MNGEWNGNRDWGFRGIEAFQRIFRDRKAETDRSGF